MTDQSNKTTGGHGLPCPECSTVTTITMEDLLARRAIYCRGCETRFTLDMERSADVLDGLREVHHAQKKVAEMRGVRTSR